MDQVHGPNFSPGVQINPSPPSSAVPEPTDWVSHSVPVMHINGTFCFKGALLCLHLHAKHPRWKHLKPRSWQADVWPQDSGHRAAGEHSPANLCSLCLTEPAPPGHLDRHSLICATQTLPRDPGIPSVGRRKKSIWNHLDYSSDYLASHLFIISAKHINTESLKGLGWKGP